MEDLTSDGADLDFREFEGAVGRSSSAFSSTPVPGRGVKNVIGRDSVHRTPTNVDSEEVPVVLGTSSCPSIEIGLNKTPSTPSGDSGFLSPPSFKPRAHTTSSPSITPKISDEISPSISNHNVFSQHLPAKPNREVSKITVAANMKLHPEVSAELETIDLGTLQKAIQLVRMGMDPSTIEEPRVNTPPSPPRPPTSLQTSASVKSHSYPHWNIAEAGDAAALPTSGSTHFERNIRALAVLELQENQRRQVEESSGTYAHTSQSQQHFNPSYTQRYYQQSHYTAPTPPPKHYGPTAGQSSYWGDVAQSFSGQPHHKQWPKFQETLNSLYDPAITPPPYNQTASRPPEEYYKEDWHLGGPLKSTGNVQNVNFDHPPPPPPQLQRHHFTQSRLPTDAPNRGGYTCISGAYSDHVDISRSNPRQAIRSEVSCVGQSSHRGEPIEPFDESLGGGGGGGDNVTLTRLEINKGGIGKSPYAEMLSSSPPPGMKQMQVRSKFGQLGTEEGQFNSPHGFCLGRNEDIVVADTHNHRIQIFDKDGMFKYVFGHQGKTEGFLWYPRKVAVLVQSGSFVVCDRGGERSRMQIFDCMGQYSHAISIRFIDIVAGLAIDSQGHIVAVDSVTPTIFVLKECGQLIRFHECSDFMKEPSDIGIFQGNYYVCDFRNHNVVVVSPEGQLLRKIGSEQVTCFPNGIDVSDAGDVLIGDSHGNKFHVAVYGHQENQEHQDTSLCDAQFECPHVKVSRCCGLKITSEGFIVTLAKNNHHVLVLDTIYVDKN